MVSDPFAGSSAELTAVREGAADLAALHARIAGRFRRSEPRRRVLAYLRGLLGAVDRKNGWQLAEQAGEATPDGMQHLLARADWDADAVRDDLRAYVVEHLGEPQAVLVVDETGFLKKGRKSVGVQRQYSGTAGRIENCQIGVFLVYASSGGRTFLDRELYLPKEWAADPERRAEAGVPEPVEFRTKPQLARAMLARAFPAGVPCGWVTADEVYGGDRRLRVWLEERKVPHVLAIKRTEPLWSATTWTEVPAERLAAALAEDAWQRLSAGDGAKGPRLYDWARIPIRPLREPGWEHWLLIRRSLADPTELAYSVCFCPTGTALGELVRVAGTRWAIEECFESAKGQVGLDQYEVRRWTGWYRHVTLALLAHAYLTVVRLEAVKKGEAGPVPATSSR
jgi:SRSO17 transposase